MAEPATTSPSYLSTNKVRELIQGNPDIKTDQDKSDFLQALVARGHEIEGLNSSFDLGEAVSNIPESAKELGSSLVHVFTTNPFQTAETLSSVARGALRKILPEPVFTAGAKLRQALPNALGGTDLTPEQQKEQDEQALSTIADMVTERYGSLDRAKNTAEKDPVGFIADISTLFTGAGGAVKGATGAAAKTGRLSFQAAKALEKTAETLTRVGNAVDPVALTLGAAKVPFKAIAKANDAVGLNKLLRKTDVNETMIEGLGLSGAERAKLTKNLKTAKVGEKLAQLGVTGSLEQMSERLGEIAGKTKLLLDKSLERITDVFRVPAAEKVLSTLKDLKGAIDFTKLSTKSQEEYNRIVQLLVKNENKGLTLSDLNEAKRGLYEMLNDRDFQNMSASANAAQSKKNLTRLYQELRVAIEDNAAKKGLVNVRKLNEQTQFATEMRKVIDNKIVRGGDKILEGKQILGKVNNILHQAVLNQGWLGRLTALSKSFFQVTRNPQFQRDLATAVQLLKDGDFKALEGGIKVARTQTAKEAKLLRRQQFYQANQRAAKVMDNVIKDLSKAYPVLRGLRLTGSAAQQLSPPKE